MKGENAEMQHGPVSPSSLFWLAVPAVSQKGTKLNCYNTFFIPTSRHLGGLPGLVIMASTMLRASFGMMSQRSVPMLHSGESKSEVGCGFAFYSSYPSAKHHPSHAHTIPTALYTSTSLAYLHSLRKLVPALAVVTVNVAAHVAALTPNQPLRQAVREERDHPRRPREGEEDARHEGYAQRPPEVVE